MSEWREEKLLNLGEIITGKTPSKNNPEDWGKYIPFVTPSDFSNYAKNAYTAIRNLSSIGAGRFIKKIIPPLSVLVTCIGSDMGKVVMNRKQVITNQQINSIIPNNSVNNDFLYYSLVDLYETLRIYGGDGTAVPIINKTDFGNLEISLPPLPEQKAIAGVLSSLDDKIDLLHRQNKTLEAMAETLFRQWFVEEAEDDWEEVTLGQFFPITTGKKDANFSTIDGIYPFFTCSQKSLMAPDYSFEGKAILLAGNGDFNIKRYSGKFEAYQRTYVLIPYEDKYFNFLYTLMKLNLQKITSAYQGSVIRFITKGMISDYAFKFPTFNVDDKLSILDSIYNRYDDNINSISLLNIIRATSLPKLMSGEFKVQI